MAEWRSVDSGDNGDNGDNGRDSAGWRVGAGGRVGYCRATEGLEMVSRYRVFLTFFKLFF